MRISDWSSDVCSSDLGDAARLIMLDDADVMIAGGAEAAVCRIGIAGFSASRALSTKFNDTPERGSRPWDVDRDGFVMAEGAGVVDIEELSHAKARGTPIHAAVTVYALSGVSHHTTTPPAAGTSRYLPLEARLKRAGTTPPHTPLI